MATTFLWVKNFAAGLACLAGVGSLGWTQAEAELLQVNITGTLSGKIGGGTPFAGSFDVDTSVGPVQHIGGLTGYADAAISNVSFSGLGISFSAADIVDILVDNPGAPGAPSVTAGVFFSEDLHPGATPSIGMAFANDGFELGLGAILCGRDGACIVPSDVNFQGLGGTVSASVVTVPVPEPSTWAMLVLGFGGLGCAGYRQARKVRVVSEAR